MSLLSLGFQTNHGHGAGWGGASSVWGSGALWENGACLNQTQVVWGGGREGGWESSWQWWSCFALKKLRFPRRQCGCGVQTFQAKGAEWAKPCFPIIRYKSEGILAICTFHCMNKGFEEQKVRSRIGTRVFLISLPIHLCRWGWAVGCDWPASELPFYRGSHSRVSQAEVLLFSRAQSFFHSFKNQP